MRWCASISNTLRLKRSHSRLRMVHCGQLPRQPCAGIQARGGCARFWKRSSDFSVALFRPDFMLASEKYPMKAHKNQQLLAMLCPPDSLMEPGARGQTI